jgi:hypothetical protein
MVYWITLSVHFWFFQSKLYISWFKINCSNSNLPHTKVLSLFEDCSGSNFRRDINKTNNEKNKFYYRQKILTYLSYFST